MRYQKKKADTHGEPSQQCCQQSPASCGRLMTLQLRLLCVTTCPQYGSARSLVVEPLHRIHHHPAPSEATPVVSVCSYSLQVERSQESLYSSVPAHASDVHLWSRSELSMSLQDTAR